ncbi:hypothetical protein ACFOD6_05310 [Tabrizicola soli]|uniref:Uncharacterized protein n=1 Tax=Tabrizicola soli TaxID=2185115 RepID=A0ABV7DSD1_9RHOB
MSLRLFLPLDHRIGRVETGLLRGIVARDITAQQAGSEGAL